MRLLQEGSWSTKWKTHDEMMWSCAEERRPILSKKVKNWTRERVLAHETLGRRKRENSGKIVGCWRHCSRSGEGWNKCTKLANAREVVVARKEEKELEVRMFTSFFADGIITRRVMVCKMKNPWWNDVVLCRRETANTFTEGKELNKEKGVCSWNIGGEESGRTLEKLWDVEVVLPEEEKVWIFGRS